MFMDKIIQRPYTKKNSNLTQKEKVIIGALEVDNAAVSLIEDLMSVYAYVCV